MTKADSTLAWYKDAKFGMFIHFDVDRRDHTNWNPDNLDTDEWVRIAKQAGMKYMVPTTHQSSYIQMWDSKVSNRDVTDVTLFRQPYLKELVESCKKEGLRMGAYYAIADPGNPLYNEPNVMGEIEPYVEYLHKVINELCEIHEPILIWFDASRRFRHPDQKKLLRQQDMVDMLHSFGTLSNSRLGDDDALKFVDYLTMNDNMAPEINLGVHWESAVELGESWHFRSYDETLKSVEEILERLINATGNGGNLLLNIGPDSHGVIPAKTEARLKEVGDWISKNEESIYGTKAGPYPYQISWGSIAQREEAGNTNLYLNVLEWPDTGEFTLFGLENKVLNASLLATGEKLRFESKFDAASGQKILTLDIPRNQPDAHVTVIKLQISGKSKMNQNHLQLTDGKVLLDAYNASIHDLEFVPGKPTKAIDMKMFTVADRRPLLADNYTGAWDYQMYKKPNEGIMPSREITVSGFHTKGQALSWDFKIYKPGSYDVAVVTHVPKNKKWESDGKMKANVAGQSVENLLIESKRMKSIAMPKSMKSYSSLGTVKIDNSGTYKLTLEVSSNFNVAKPRLYGVELIPINK
ncbi:alpha-L-fucosidase [Tamlana agarivorans]|uniref:Alpha-L-fucosidase n=1 Tax=Pseudotamlana agarivorans TaxID=481183 RepID=A0ACC5U977_9FLAO|nr:alpha-L-fucosidase [Tamlana agarivorans]MBU2950879.1 alpha-L-fucosidase [Tamlana agarivorans]